MSVLKLGKEMREEGLEVVCEKNNYYELSPLAQPGLLPGEEASVSGPKRQRAAGLGRRLEEAEKLFVLLGPWEV